MDRSALTLRFEETVTVDQVRLDVGAALIAAHADASVDVDQLVDRLDGLSAEVAEPTLDGLLGWYRGAGFEGDRATYRDPANSYLHQVLDRRLGIPITLSVVLIEVGRRVGVPLAGVSMPGHFLLRDRVDPAVLVDAFDRGRLLDEAGARELHARLHGPDGGFHPSFLAPVEPVHILTRMLANLRMIFTERQDLRSLAWVLRLRTLLPTVDPGEHRALASVLATRGQYVEAAELLEDLATRVEGDPAERFLHEATQLRAMLN